MKMAEPKKPKVCDCCSKDVNLYWSKDDEMWICDECKESLDEKRYVDECYYGESLRHMDYEEGDF
ncbi:hypothetical protein D4R86_00865 [bacterium]|nr:MAG: hypothetical protein D4R86_00865 [bacterium]